MLVPIDSAAQGFLAVIEMEEFQVLQADDSVEFGEGVVIIGFRPNE